MGFRHHHAASRQTVLEQPCYDSDEDGGDTHICPCRCCGAVCQLGAYSSHTDAANGIHAPSRLAVAHWPAVRPPVPDAPPGDGASPLLRRRKAD